MVLQSWLHSTANSAWTFVFLSSSLVYLVSVPGLHAQYVPFTSSATAVLEHSLF